MGEASKALGVSIDTLRRWDRAGKLNVTRDPRNQRRIPVTEVHRLRLESELEHAADDLATQLRVRGVVRSIKPHGIKTLVELHAGALEISTVVTPETLRRLELEEGSEAIVTIRTTAVLIEPVDS